MPGFNKKGPAGEGPLSGRGKGCCAAKGQGRFSTQTGQQEPNTPENKQEERSDRLWGLRRGRRRGNTSGR